MPTILTPQSQAGDLDFQNAVSDLLQTFCSQLLLNDSPVLSPTAGYKAYQKRMAFAKKASKNPKAYVQQACTLISFLDSVMLSQTVQNQGVPLFRFLFSDNPAGANLLECEATIGYNSVGVTSGRSIFEGLAGITQEDYL